MISEFFETLLTLPPVTAIALLVATVIVIYILFGTNPLNKDGRK